MELTDKRAQKNSQRGGLRKQKGWKGFVQGYAKRREIFDEIWPTIDWNNDPEKSGAKSVRNDGKGKIIYTF